MTWNSVGLVAVLALCCAGPVGAATYYVSSAGSDAHAGTSPRAAWQTLRQVNATSFRPGDKVLFRRGDRWRGQLRPCSGSAQGVVTYGAYGEGAKPVLLGSVAKGKPSDWREETPHVWVTGEAAAPAPGALPAPTTSALPWRLYTEGTAKATGTAGEDGAASFRVECTASGEAAQEIQLFLLPFSLRAGQSYRVTFRARSSRPFSLRVPDLMQAGPPWASYSASPATRAVPVSETWQSYAEDYEARVTAKDARLTFFLGGRLPAGATLWIDRLSLTPCAPAVGDGRLTMDVGNVLFDNGASCGVKKWHEADLKQQDDFWYDTERQVLKVYSVGNPTAHHRSLECALTRHIIDESGASYVTYEQLDLRYGGAHGIGGGGTHHITVRDCDISFIGGGFMQLEGRPVRYGNGIEFWGAAHDNRVERCRLWEIYDAALTNQNAGETVVVADISYRDNVIWNSEYSFEYWNRPEASRTRNVRFEHNTCVNAGHGWGHRQRPDPGGRHLCLYYSPAPAEGLVIRDNVFAEATDNALYAPDWSAERLAELALDHNLWYQPQGDMVLLKTGSYPLARFTEYQQAQRLDAHSLAAPPRFVNAAQHDYRLAPGSPGADLGVGAHLQ